MGKITFESEDGEFKVVVFTKPYEVPPGSVASLFTDKKQDAFINEVGKHATALLLTESYKQK